MTTVVQSLLSMLTGCVMCYIIVFIAMAVDFVSGWNKAKQRHEAHNSTAQSRSVMKFIVYEGGMLIASGIDAMIHLTNIYDILSIPLLRDVPVVTIFIGIFLCAVEISSVKEKAEEKTKKHMMLTEDLIREIVETTSKQNKINPKDIADQVIKEIENNKKKKHDKKL